MSDVYKIAVSLSMTSNAGSVLTAIAKQTSGLSGDLSKLEKQFGTVNRAKLALFGMAGIAVGSGLLFGLKGAIDAAKELNHQLASVRTLAANPIASAALASQALITARATANSVRGTTLDSNAKIFGESYSMFGADAAKINAPLARYAMAIGGTTGDYEKANEGLYAMLRSSELMGKLVDEKTHRKSPEKLLNFLDTAAKISAATHGKVDANTFLGMAQQGGPALAGMSDEGLMAMAMVAQGMGGFRAGTALTGLYQQFKGGRMTAPVAEELKKLGLIGDFENGRGGHLQFKPGALDTPFAAALGKDPMAASAMMQKALTAHGFADLDSQTSELFKILGRQTTQRIVSDFIRNMPQMLGERSRIEGAQGVDDQNKTREGQDYERNLRDLAAAWTNLREEIGNPLMTSAIGVLGKLTTGLRTLDDAVVKMGPEKIAAIGNGIAILGGSLVAAGGAALFLALGPAGWFIAGVGALGAAVAVFAPNSFDNIINGLHKLYDYIADPFKDLFGGKPSDAYRGGQLDQLTPGRGMTGLRHHTAFLDDASGIYGGSGSPMALAVKAGVVDGFRALTGLGGGMGSGSASGLINASWGGGGGTWNGHALSVGAGTGIGHTASQAERAAFIRAYAAHIGIDPTTALRVAQSEGFNVFTGDHGTSFGDFQMHVGGGLGDKLRVMGINPADPHQWMRSDKFALDWARHHGWGDWHGAARVGIGRTQGIGVPRAREHETTIRVPVVIDGKQITEIVTKRQAKACTFPHGINASADSFGSYVGPGTTFQPA